MSLSSTISIYILILIGGYVKATGAGMACPDWPLCHGRIVPELAGPVLIEYAHRLWTIVTTLLVFSTMALAWKGRRRSAGTFLTSSITAGLIVLQILLGMVTVRMGLHPLIVTSHLGLATAIFGSATVNAMLAFKKN